MLTDDERRALRVIHRLGVVRTADLAAHGIPRQRLYQLVRKGKVERQARGIYAASNHPHTTEHALAQVAKRGPERCDLPAYRVAVPRPHDPASGRGMGFLAGEGPQASARLPAPSGSPLFRRWPLRKAIETHRIEGVDVRVYSAAKTVADCFKYRHKIGIDVPGTWASGGPWRVRTAGKR